MAINGSTSIDPTCPTRFELRHDGIDDADETIISALLAGTKASDKTATNTFVSITFPWLRKIARKHLDRLDYRDLVDEDDVAIDVLLVFIEKFASNRFPAVNEASSLRRLLTRMARDSASAFARRYRNRCRKLKKNRT